MRDFEGDSAGGTHMGRRGGKSSENDGAFSSFRSIVELFIQLQREQQEAMHRFLELQEKFLDATWIPQRTGPKPQGRSLTQDPAHSETLSLEAPGKHGAASPASPAVEFSGTKDRAPSLREADGSKKRDVATAQSLESDPVRRYVLKAAPVHGVERGAEKRDLPAPEGDVVCLLSDARWADAVQDLLPGGLRPVFAYPGDRNEALDERHHRVNFESEDSIVRFRESLARSGKQVCGLVNFTALGAILREEDPPFSDFGRVKHFFLLAKVFSETLQQRTPDRAGRIINLSAMDGRFGLKDPSRITLGDAAVVGLMKSLAREWPDLNVKAIDLEPSADRVLLKRRLFQEWSDDTELVEVGQDREGRWRIDVEHSPSDPRVPSFLPLNSASVILITGGGLGITAAVAKGLAAKYRPQIILVGRSRLDPGDSSELDDSRSLEEIKEAMIRRWRSGDPRLTPAAIETHLRGIQKVRELHQNLEAMRAAGARVEYHALDVRDAGAFELLIEDLYRRHGRLDGVIHGAGINEDKLARHKTLDSFSRVFDTKVLPAVVLSRKLDSETLRFLIFFSSVVGRFGNSGQCDYGAANEVLNKLARRLDQEWPARVLSLGWGPWDSGMVRGTSKQLFEKKGINLIPLELGVAEFLKELHLHGGGSSEVLIFRDLRNLQ